MRHYHPKNQAYDLMITSYLFTVEILHFLSISNSVSLNFVFGALVIMSRPDVIQFWYQAYDLHQFGKYVKSFVNFIVKYEHHGPTQQLQAQICPKTYFGIKCLHFK